MAQNDEWWKADAPVQRSADGDWWSADKPVDPPKPRRRSLLEAANDLVIEGANAAAGGLTAAANFVAPGNRVSEFIENKFIKAGEEKQSDIARGAKQELAKGIEGADGIMGELGAVGKYVAQNPLLATSQALGSFALPGAAVKGAGALATGLGAGARGATLAGQAGGVAAGTAMAGGDAAGTAYELSKNAGATEEQAQAAARQASIIPAAVGGITGAFGAERILAGGRGFSGGMVSRGLKTGLSEAAQEALEEGVTQFEGQRAAMPFDETIDPTKGVAAAAGLGAALGFIPGAGIGALSAAGDQQARQPLVNVAGVQRDPVQEVPEVAPVKPSEAMGLDPAAGPLSAAAAQAVDAGASAVMQPVPAEPMAPQPATPLAADVRQADVQPAPDLAARTTEELRAALRNAQEPNIRKAVAAELSKRKREEAASLPDLLQTSERGFEFSAVDESFDGAAVNAKLFRDLSDASAIKKQWLDVVNPELDLAVQRNMLRIAQNPEILNAVVELIPVNVVDMLRRRQLTPEMVFNNPSVLKSSLIRGNSNDSIAIPVDGAAAIMRAVAMVAAKNKAVDQIAHSGGLSVNGNAAANTGVPTAITPGFVDSGGQTGAPLFGDSTSKVGSAGGVAKDVRGANDLGFVSRNDGSALMAIGGNQNRSPSIASILNQAQQKSQKEPQEPAASQTRKGQPLTDTGTNMLGRWADPLQAFIQGENDARRAAEGLRGDDGAGTGAGVDNAGTGVAPELGAVRGRGTDTTDAQPAAQGDAGQRPAGTADSAPSLRPDGWRKNALKAGRVARGLGLNPKGKRLAEIVAEIDAVDAGTDVQNAPQGTERKAPEAPAVEAPAPTGGNAPAAAGSAGAGQGAGVRADGVRQKPTEESQQDKSIREWTENYDRIANTDDLSTVDTKDIVRAIAWASRRKQSEARKGWDGGQPNQNLLSSLEEEIARLKAEESRRNNSAAPGAGDVQADGLGRDQPPVEVTPSGMAERRAKLTGADRWPAPRASLSGSEVDTAAQRKVVDYMNGDISRTELMNHLEQSGLPYGKIASFTQRIGNDGPSIGEIDAMMARRESDAKPQPTPTNEPLPVQDAAGKQDAERSAILGRDSVPISEGGKPFNTKAEADRAAERTAAQEEERKRIAKASEQAADTFELGGDAMANLTGQQDIFGAAPAQQEPQQPPQEEQKGEGETQFSIADSNERDLIVTHNLTAENLLHAVKMGGLPVPSLAVTKKDSPLDGFGEITLIGKKEMADPKGYAKTQVFGADIYSPRYPTVQYKAAAKALNELDSKLKTARDLVGGRLLAYGEIDRNGPKELERDPSVAAAFLQSKDIDVPVVRKAMPKPLQDALMPFVNDARDSYELAKSPDFVEASIAAHREILEQAYGDAPDAKAEIEREIAKVRENIATRGTSQLARSYASEVSQHRKAIREGGQIDPYATQQAIDQVVRDAGFVKELRAYAKDLFDGLNAEEKIFRGFTASGNRKYVPHTLDNVVKILKEELRGGENFNYGVGSVRAKLTPKFTSVDAIRKAKGRLVTKEQFDAIKDEVNKELIDLSERLTYKQGGGTISTDMMGDVIVDAAKYGVRRAAEGLGVEVSDDAAQDVAEFMQKLRNLPTAYFEAKIMRPVALAEFAAAVVPKDTDQKVIDALKREGITKILAYDKAENRAGAVQAMSESLGDEAMFSIAEETASAYADQKKFPALFEAVAGRQLPGTALQNKPGTKRILTEKNLAGYRKNAGGLPLFKMADQQVAKNLSEQHNAPSGMHAQAVKAFADRLNKQRARPVEMEAVSPGTGERGKMAKTIQGVARKLFNRDVVFVRFTNGDPLFNGAVSQAAPGKVFINIDSQRPMMAVLGHELLHELRKSDEGAYQALRTRLDALLADKSHPIYANILAVKYEKAGMKSLPRDIAEELYADIVGDHFTEPQFWQALTETSKEKPLVWKRLLNAVARWLESIGKKLGRIKSTNDGDVMLTVAQQADGKRPFGTGAFLTDVEASRQAVLDAIKGFDGRQAKGVDGDVKLSAAEKQDQTETAAFKRWFGDWQDPLAFSSKRDKNKPPVSMAMESGRPMVLYHATNGDFNTFEVARPTINSTTFGDVETQRYGVFATQDMAFAEEYFRGRDGANIMPVYMNVKSPVDLTDGLGGDVITDIVENSSLNRRDFYDVYTTDLWQLFDGEFGRQVVDALKKAGYDGAIMKELSRDREREVEVWVAFEPSQVKSATGNQGAFDPENPDIRFSIADARDNLSQVMPQKVMDLYADATTSQRGFNRWWHRTVGTQLHKAKINKDFGRVFYSVQDFMRDVSRMATIAADKAPTLLTQIESLSDVGKAVPMLTNPARMKERKANLKAASDALFDGTLKFTRDANGKPVEAMDAQDGGIVWTNAELKERGLSPEAIKMYREGRAAIDQSLDNMLAADIYRVITTMDPEMLVKTPEEWTEFTDRVRKMAASDKPMDAVDATIDAMNERAAELENEVNTLRNMADEAEGEEALFLNAAATEPQTKLDGLREEIKRVEEKRSRIKSLKKAGYAPLMRFGEYAVSAYDETGQRVYFGLYESQFAANRAARKFNEQGLRTDKSVMSKQEFEQLKGLSPETAMLFAEMLGVEKNEAMQTWLKNAVAEQSALKRHIRRKGVSGFDDDSSRVVAAFLTSNSRAASRALHSYRIEEAVANVRQGDVKDEAIKLADYVNNPKEEAQAVRSLLFVNYIGGSVSSALVNLTQTFVQTYPFLSQYGGAVKAGQRVSSAMRMAMSKNIANKEIAEAVKQAENDGVIKPQEVFQLQAEASRTLGSNLYARTGLALWGSFFQLAEVYNRRVAFIAAYQTAKQEGIRNPFAFAENAVNETQGIFNKGNRPNWSRGAVGATLFTFKTFTIQYVEFLKRMPPKQRAVALGVLFLMAGAGGFPFAEDAEDLIDTVAQGLGYNFTTKSARDEFLRSTLGDGWATFIQSGVSPWTPFDVSQRLGMADLLPGTGILKKSETRKEDQALEIFGVAGSFVRDALKGEVRPIAFRNAAKAIEMYDMGVYRDTRGRKVMEVDPLDAILKSIGLQPSKVAEESRKIGMQYEKRALYEKVRNEITEQMALGQYENDPEKVARAREAAMQWNEKNPEAPMFINMQNVWRRVREMNLDRTDRFLKSAPKELRGQIQQAIQ